MRAMRCHAQGHRTRRVLLLVFSILFPSLLTDISFAARPFGVPDPATIEYPNGKPPTPAEILLGKTLFFDTRLSSNEKQSCATCHNPALGFSDGVTLGKGTTGTTLTRHTPHLFNLAWGVAYFWDGRASSLEEQAIAPIESAVEMNLPIETLIQRLQNSPEYVKLFQEAYPKTGIARETIGQAIAAYERTIISNNSLFDKYIKGDKNALPPAALRGMELFTGKANCLSCHDGVNFTDDGFYNIGLGGEDPGRGALFNDPSLLKTFRTPGLRNVALTAPYMHDGSLPTLTDVIRFYNEGGKHKQGISDVLKPLQLTESEVTDLVAFLHALTDPAFAPRKDASSMPAKKGTRSR